MKRLITVLAFATAAFCACSRYEQSLGYGRISFDAKSGDQVTIDTRASLGLTLPASGDFALAVSNSNDEVVVEQSRLSDYDNATLYAVGNYTASVSYGSLLNEAFDTPCFTGSKSFAVLEDQTTQVSIDATIANAVVKVKVSDKFDKWFDDYSFTLTTYNGTELHFAKGESRMAYIDPYKMTVSGSVTRAGVQSTIAAKEFEGLKAATLYTLSYDVNEGQVGTATITITFNEEFVAEVSLDEELNPNA